MHRNSSSDRMRHNVTHSKYITAEMGDKGKQQEEGAFTSTMLAPEQQEGHKRKAIFSLMKEAVGKILRSICAMHKICVDVISTKHVY